jgi:hypothetical protein
LIKGKTIGLDATTLEANAALRSRRLADGLQNRDGIRVPKREDHFHHDIAVTCRQSILEQIPWL